jgi:nucleoside-diphosphate-sugar epimerase
VLIAGATGLVGQAALEYFLAQNVPVVTLSRRKPAAAGAEIILADLRDNKQMAEALAGRDDITEVVYAAVYEKGDLVSGWGDSEQIATNDRMLRNVLEPLTGPSSALRHVCLMQGSKAYGSHVRPLPIPAREGRAELREQPNFYWVQEDYLRERQKGQNWFYTIFRPVPILGDSSASALNLITGIGIYAAFMRRRGTVLPYPGGGQKISQVVDVEIVAWAFDWARKSEQARNEIFNLANGDVYVWHEIWPAIADAVGMKPGDPVPMRLSALAERSNEWDEIRAANGLSCPGLAEFGGSSLQFADYVLRTGHPEPGPPTIISTIKIMQAGFREVRDTEQTFVRYLKSMQRKRLLPAP